MKRTLVVFFVLIAFAVVTFAAQVFDEKCKKLPPIPIPIPFPSPIPFPPPLPPLPFPAHKHHKSKSTSKTTTTATRTTTTTTSSAATPTSPAQADNNICKTSNRDPGNGTQKRDGECSSTVQGEVPDVNHMVSTLIVEPAFGSVLKANASFTVVIASTGLHVGYASDPNSEYFVFPQELDENGLILGNYRITVQKLESVVKPPDARLPIFFRGIESFANEENRLSVEVLGLATGLYRICAMGGSKSHQPLLMPVAQRGAQDDCIRVTVK